MAGEQDSTERSSWWVRHRKPNGQLTDATAFDEYAFKEQYGAEAVDALRILVDSKANTYPDSTRTTARQQLKNLGLDPDKILEGSKNPRIEDL